jgi:hypothetical protein
MRAGNALKTTHRNLTPVARTALKFKSRSVFVRVYTRVDPIEAISASYRTRVDSTAFTSYQGVNTLEVLVHFIQYFLVTGLKG